MSTSVAVEHVFAHARLELARRERAVPFQEIKAASRDCAPTRDGLTALLEGGCSVIPEIKRHSPGQGHLRDLDTKAAGVFAAELEEAGAGMIAVQTEPHRFAGSLEDLAAVAAAVEVPVMVRDLIFDPYQIHEARVHGADVIPLIADYLDADRLAALVDRAASLGMTPMVEARTYPALERALAAGAKVVGVDARDPVTGAVDRGLLAEITTGLPESVARVALSGVRSARDVLAYASAGADAVVVGQTVMTDEDPAACVRTLSAAGNHPACPRRVTAR